jgi:hypothetical protein
MYQIMKYILMFGFIFLAISVLKASEMSHGYISGIIRSAGHPCAHILELHQINENSWKAVCNAGPYSVTKISDDQYSVTPLNNDQKSE